MRHGVAYPVHHKPRAFIGDAKHPVYLVRAHTLFARAKQVNSQKPFIERDAAIFKYRANRNRKLLAAFGAFPQALTRPCFRFGFGLNLITVRCVAMRAYRTIRPAHGFDELAGGLFAAKMLRQVVKVDLFAHNLNASLKDI